MTRTPTTPAAADGAGSVAFTAGPWKWLQPTAIDWRDPVVMDEKGNSTIAHIAGGGPVRAISGAEAKANARLIAAAPNLYAALKAARGWVINGTESEQARRDLKLVDDALALARTGTAR